MIVVFKLDREGRGIGTRYRYEAGMEDPEFLPGLGDTVRVRGYRVSGDHDERPPRVVWRRTFDVADTGEVRVTIYADQPMDLIKRRKDERIEELSARELWR